MSFYVNDKELETVTFNGQVVTEIYYNNTRVWEKPFVLPEGPFEWGSSDEIGDAIWWLKLQEWVRTAEEAELLGVVGMTKKMSLSQTFLGANTVTMRCIGANQDGEHTLVFQAAGGLPEPMQFGDTYSRYWADNGKYTWIPQAGETQEDYPYTDSNARKQCQLFYECCGARAAIKPVHKGTVGPGKNVGTSSGNKATYTVETVFLLSEYEYGFNEWSSLDCGGTSIDADGYSTQNTSITNSECTYGYDEPYAWWDGNLDMVSVMDSDGNVLAIPDDKKYNLTYWTRSSDVTSTKYTCLIRSTNQGETYKISYWDKYGDVVIRENVTAYRFSDRTSLADGTHYFQPAFVIG